MLVLADRNICFEQNNMTTFAVQISINKFNNYKYDDVSRP